MIITTFEHATLTQFDFPIATDFNWLLEQNFDVFQIGRKHHQWQLKVRHYIGVIGLPSGFQLEILPKIGGQADILQTRQWLQTMLTEIWHSLTPKTLPNLAKQTPINPQLPLNDWLNQQFWQRFATYQPNQRYQRFEQNQNFLQGKLLVKQQLQHNHHQPHKFFHQSENFANDTDCNRLVKTTLQYLGTNHSLSHYWHGVQTILPNGYHSTFQQAQQELHALPTAIAQQNLDFISFCYSLLTLQQASGQGQSHSQTLLINMQFAFEKWVSYRLTQQFKNATVLEQYSQALTVNHELMIKPDVVIKSENAIKVIDIKWKNIQTIGDIQLADMYQLLTYASQFNADEAWLIVPSLDNQPKQEIQLVKAMATQFYLVPFCVNG